jgi:predicted RNA methylase
MRIIKDIINTDVLIKYLDEIGITDEKLILSEINKSIKSILQDRVPIDIELPEDSILFKEIYPDYDMNLLPQWVIDNIDKARIIGNAKQTVILPDGRRYQLNNILNHLSGGEWVFFTNSVLNTRYLTSGKDSCAHKIRKIHPTPKPPLLMCDIIKFFTKENEMILDYFMGVGGSLLGAAMCGRKGVGIDLNNEYIEAYKLAAKSMEVEEFPTAVGDALSLLSDKELMEAKLNNAPVSLILIDPPYGDMMSKAKTGADIDVYGATSTPFTNSKNDLGNMERANFLTALKTSVEMSIHYLKPKGHIVVFIKDLQPNKKDVNLLHAEIVYKLNEIPNLNFKGLRIWADQTAKLFPYGYPFSFVANQIHQYILIFRKEK